MGQLPPRPRSGRLALEGAAGLAKEIARRCPEWHRAARQAVEQLGIDTRLVVDSARHAQMDRARAVQGLFLQASNDFLDLMFDTSAGRGRPAIRSARTLFEHHVAVLDVDADPGAATRWLDHLPMSALAEGQLTLPEQHLRGNALKGFRHRMKRLRTSSEREVARVVDRWGPEFRRHWHPLSLFDRATAYGLVDHYTFYRYASAPVHGSHAGLAGLVKEIRGKRVMRSGPALAPAPLAVLYGTASMRVIVRVAEQFVEGGLKRMHRALDALDAAWQDYYEEINRFDEELWSTSPPSNAGALVVIQPTGESAWFEYLPDQLLARRARSNEVVVHDEQRRPLDMLLQDLLPAVEHGRVGICLHGAVVAEPGNGPWIDSPELIDSSPFQVYEDGRLGFPSDFNPPPNTHNPPC